MPPLIQAALALLNLLVADSHFTKSGAGTPSAIGAAITAILKLAVEDPTFSKPNSVTNILKDLESALSVADVVVPPEVQSRLDAIKEIVSTSETNIQNIANGQAAIIGKVTESIQGKPVKVDVFAVREDASNEITRDLGID